MPKVEERKARKDYPQQGIQKGDTYFYTSLKTQRGGIVLRSKTPFKPSQLTQSEFKSGFLAAGESWEESDKDSAAAEAAAEAIRELGDGCQERFDNMPEGLQQGETGQQLENRASECESIASEIDYLVIQLQELEESEPAEVDFDHRPEDAEEDEDPELVNKDGETFDEAHADWESRVDEAREEIGAALGNMPE